MNGACSNHVCLFLSVLGAILYGRPCARLPDLPCGLAPDPLGRLG